MYTQQELRTLDSKQIYALWTPLSSRDPFAMTEADIDFIAKTIMSDGCTGVKDFYVCACHVHDAFYITRKDFYGYPITKAEADKIFRKLIQKKSPFGALSPMSWWRWAAVATLGKFFWK